MAFDPHANLIEVTVTVAPSPATSGTTLSISDSDAGVLDAAGLNPSISGAFNASVAPSSPRTTLNTEIIRFTAKGSSSGGDTQYTITRQAESGGVNRSIIVGDVIKVTITKKTITDIENTLPFHALARQAIINGNFDIWQRATSMTNPVSNSIAADRWRLSFANSGTLPTTIIHSRQALTPGDIPNSFYHYRIAPNGAGSGFATGNFYNIQQPIEHGVRFLAGAGKKVTISFYAKSDIAGKKLGIGLQQEYGTGGSPSGNDVLTGQVVTLTNAWVKYTATINLSTLVGKTFGTNDDDVLRLFFFLMWGATIGSSYLSGAAAETFGGSGNIDIAQVQVCAGDTALTFQPMSYEEQLRKCYRYYEVGSIGSNSGTELGNILTVRNSSAGNKQVGMTVPYKVSKRTNNPSITLSGGYAFAQGSNINRFGTPTIITGVGGQFIPDGYDNFYLYTQDNTNFSTDQSISYGFSWSSDAEL